MDEDRLYGTARNLGGKAEEGVGRVTGDVKTQVKGKLDTGDWDRPGPLRPDRGCRARYGRKPR